ncbi:MAG TPA: ribose-phosphate pyrophosphokinase [Kofleriaceae bacterium]|nr:ribose-phosphate pyrophosphokinase [Kofleriaceae bacterium]
MMDEGLRERATGRAPIGEHPESTRELSVRGRGTRHALATCNRQTVGNPLAARVLGGMPLAASREMAKLEELLLFVLGPSETLGRFVAERLGIAVAPHELRRFEDGEHKIRPLVSARGRDVYVLCSLYGDASESVDDRLIRALFFVGSLRDAGAGRITLVAPYLCYARKDRRTNPRDPVTTRYVARMIEAAGADRVVTVDVHNLAAYENAFRIGTEHLEARPLFVERCRALGDRLAVVSPDPGGFHRAEALRDALEHEGASVELAMLGKHRKGGVVRTEAFVGDVEGRSAVIVDDLIVSGTTLVRAAEACRARGATAVHAMATHAMFGPAAAGALATPLIDAIVVTDSVSPERTALGEVRAKLAVASIAPLLAGAIGALHHERSMAQVIEAGG